MLDNKYATRHHVRGDNMSGVIKNGMNSAGLGRVKIWSFREAPAKYQRLFPGSSEGWLAHIPESERQAVDRYILQSGPARVTSVELADGSVVYCGKQGARDKRSRAAASPLLANTTKRSDPRVQRKP